MILRTSKKTNVSFKFNISHLKQAMSYDIKVEKKEHNYIYIYIG